MHGEGKRSLWKEEPINRDVKAITSSLLKKFGLKLDNIKFVKNLEELRKTPPNIIIAEAIRNFGFIQNHFKKQLLYKKLKYIMGLGVFQQLQVDNNNKKKKLLKPSKIKFKSIYRPYRGQNLDGKTILIFRTGGAGDLIFINPNLIYIKEKYPTCKIKFACGPQYQSMIETWDCIDEVLDLPFLFKHLQEADYHILFEGVIERCEEAKYVNSFNLFSRWIGLDLPDEKLIPYQEPKKELVKKCSKILEDWNIKDKPFILMQLRASSSIRTPRHEFWIKIINELNNRGYIVLITDNPRQKDEITKFIKMVNKPEMTFNFCQYSKSFDYTIALTSLCKATISTDSALNHISASLDVFSFGIFGPFPGTIRLKTYPKAAWVDAEIECGPCFLHGQDPCPQAKRDGYSPCYDKLIETDEKLKEVIDKFEDLVND